MADQRFDFRGIVIGGLKLGEPTATLASKLEMATGIPVNYLTGQTGQLLTHLLLILSPTLAEDLRPEAQYGTSK
jgi:hypothetical protein